MADFRNIHRVSPFPGRRITRAAGVCAAVFAACVGGSIGPQAMARTTPPTPKSSPKPARAREIDPGVFRARAASGKTDPGLFRNRKIRDILGKPLPKVTPRSGRSGGVRLRVRV